jgi:putative ABC transport system substrate-binding protein
LRRDVVLGRAVRRRNFIKGIASSAAVWPLVAHAQQSAMPVIGFLNGGSALGYDSEVDAFHQGLKQAGYVEGQNLAIEYRWTKGQAPGGHGRKSVELSSHFVGY